MARNTYGINLFGYEYLYDLSFIEIMVMPLTQDKITILSLLPCKCYLHLGTTLNRT